MGFEVVGLPHYVIWHVYEPSEDDLVRMEQMEKEKEIKQLDVEDVEVSKARWEQDRKAVEAAIEKQKKAKSPGDDKTPVVGGVEGPVAHVGEEGVAADQENGLTGLVQENIDEV
jgi:mannan polymerase II complex ANP1 subunit